jgi:hypothetical protein
MGAVSKVVDSAVIVGSVMVGISAINGIISGAKVKSATIITISALTMLISIYALKEGVRKINE